MRTIFLQGGLSIIGRDALGARRLVDRLRELSDELLLGHIIYTQSVADGADPRLRSDIISEVELLQFRPDVIVLEDGLFAAPGSWRIAPPLATEFVEKGGTLVVADVDGNRLREQRIHYEDERVVSFLGAVASYCGSEPVGGYDEQSFWKGTKQIVCRPPDMIVDDWLRPIYSGISEIIAGLPVRLASWGSILASGNTNSTWSDATDGVPGPDNLPFASVAKRGAGFVAVICANVTGDAWLSRCPQNMHWLTNIAEFLSENSLAERRRSGSTLKSSESVFLSHSHDDRQTVEQVHRRLAREFNLGVWLDQEQLIAGDKLPAGLEQAIQRASWFVLFWSRAAARSEWVGKELEMAHGKRDLAFLLVRLEDIAVPDALANLIRIEATDLSPAEIADRVSEAIERRQLKARIERARQAT